MRVVLGSETNRMQIRTVATRPETPVTYLYGLHDVEFDRFALSNGQMLIYNTESEKWNAVDRFAAGSLPPDEPHYGDIWYYTVENKLFMWVTDGVGEFWFDFLPPIE